MKRESTNEFKENLLFETDDVKKMKNRVLKEAKIANRKVSKASRRAGREKQKLMMELSTSNEVVNNFT